MSGVPAAFTAAVRRLLERGLLTPSTEGWAETYVWRTELRAFFSRVAGLEVQSDLEVLRLVFPPPFPESGRLWSRVRSPRAAALVVWLLWYHEYLGMRLGEVRQFTLAELADAITRNPRAAGLDFTQAPDRRAMIQAVRALEDVGALRVLDVEAGDWEQGVGRGGALLEFTPAAPYLISAVQLRPASPAQRAVRALLTGPALTRAQDPEAFAALETPEVEEAVRSLGWALERQSTYALLRREGHPSGFAARWEPARSTGGAVALLLLEALRAEVRSGQTVPDEDGRLTVSRNRLYTLLSDVRDRHRVHWGEKGKVGSEKLLDAALALWREWGGVAQEDGMFVTLEPHLSRFGAGYGDRESLATPSRHHPDGWEKSRLLI